MCLPQRLPQYVEPGPLVVLNIFSICTFRLCHADGRLDLLPESEFFLERELHRVLQDGSTEHAGTLDLRMLSCGEIVRASKELKFTGSLGWADDMTQSIARDRIRAAVHMHHIRQVLISCVCIAMVGVKNAGKSTVVNQLFGVNATTGFLNAGETGEPTMYHCGRDDDASLSVLDFPGTSSKELELREAFERCAVVSPVCVVVLQPGHVGRAEYEVVHAVTQQLPVDQCIVLFNQVASGMVVGLVGMCWHVCGDWLTVKIF